MRLLTADHHELLADPQVDMVYVAVPHHLHETLYLDVLGAGKDLCAEKPFGIDLAAARRGRFVRCSSEFPFLPGAQRAYKPPARAVSAPCRKSTRASITAATSTPPSPPTGNARSKRAA